MKKTILTGISSSLLFVLLIVTFVLSHGSVHAQDETPDGPIYIVQEGDSLWTIAIKFGVSIEELQNIDGLGDKTAESIATFFASEENILLINRLKNIGVKIKEKRKENLPFKDKKFILTGTLIEFTRPKASDLIKQKGGIIKSSIGKDIDYVIVGEKPGSKYDKAIKLKLKIINEEQFKKLIEGE